MRRILSILAAATALMLALAGTAVSAPGASPATILGRGNYSSYWTNGVNDTLYILAAIEYDTVTEKGRLSLVVQCYKGNPSDHVTNKCKLQGGTKVWENYTTGGTVSAPIGAQDNGSYSYIITGTWRSMVDSNSYNSRAKSIYVLFHGSGRTSFKHTVCSIPWSELYGTGAGPACSPA
jgi:hypothetical protein